MIHWFQNLIFIITFLIGQLFLKYRGSNIQNKLIWSNSFYSGNECNAVEDMDHSEFMVGTVQKSRTICSNQVGCLALARALDGDINKFGDGDNGDTGIQNDAEVINIIKLYTFSI